MSYDVLLLSFEGLVSITNNFSDEYLIKETSISKVYTVNIKSSQLSVEQDDKEDCKEDDKEDCKEEDCKEDDKEDDKEDCKEDDEADDLLDIVIRRSTNGRQHRELNNDFMLSMYNRHTNILPILGVFLEDDEMHELISVTKYQVNGSLDKHLSNPTTLTWIRRLRICVGVARAMSYLHYGLKKQNGVIHGNIQSSRILLDDEWEPKLYGFQYSIVCHRQQLCLTSKYGGTIQYMDPAYEETRGLTLKSDVFSFGVVLFELLFGRKASIVNEDKWYFAKLAKRHYEDKILDHMIDPVLRQQMDMQSLDIFAKTAYYCLNEQRAQRLNTHEVLEKLGEALDHQMKYENPELATMEDEGTLFIHPKLFSLGSNGERNEMISARKFRYKKHWVRKWRSLPADSRFPKVAEVFDISNLMIEIKTRTQFLSPGVSYKVNLIFRFRVPRKIKLFHKPMYVDFKYKMGGENLHAYFATWRDDGWMMLELCRFLCYKEDTNFEVLLESFSRCYSGSRTIYIEGIEFQAIDNVIIDKVEKVEEVQAIGNVMKYEDIESIEEVQFTDNVIIDKVEKVEEVQAIDNVMKYEDIESIEEVQFIDNVRHVEIGMLKKVQEFLKSNSKREKDVSHGFLNEEPNLTPSAQSSTSRSETGNDETLEISENHDECDELLSVSSVNTNEHHMLSAKDFVYDTSDIKLLQLKPSVQSRFQEVVELRSQQVLHIKCRIRFQMSPNTEYACYLVFKLSERCCGLHSPVIVRDLLHWKRDTGILYFRSPSPWNLHDTNWVPEKRKDGWMEVNVWKFNSDFELRYGSVPMNLKLVTYEGTMSGLIIWGLEIRPI